MRIVHLDQNFHPEYGDQINILPKYQAKKNNEVYIVTGNRYNNHPRFGDFAYNENMQEKDKEFENRTGVKIRRVRVKKFISGRAIYEKEYKKIIDNLNPDILFCHYNDTLPGIYYSLFVNRLKYPVIFDSHMLKMASQNKFRKLFRLFYRWVVTPKIKKYNLTVIKTQKSNYINKELGIPKSQTPYIPFGTDMNLFHPDEGVKINFRKKYNISKNAFVIIYTGKLTKSKGAKLLAKGFKKEFNTNKNIVLIVVGKGSGEYGSQVKEIFDNSNNRVIKFPLQKYVELPKFYQAADLSVFPKQCSLSFYDAQACGLPVLLENNEINIKRTTNDNGLTFKSGDLNDFRDKITKILNMSDCDYKNISKNAYNNTLKNFNYEDIAKQYDSIIENEIEKFEQR